MTSNSVKREFPLKWSHIQHGIRFSITDRRGYSPTLYDLRTQSIPIESFMIHGVNLLPLPQHVPPMRTWLKENDVETWRMFGQFEYNNKSNSVILCNHVRFYFLNQEECMLFRLLFK